MAQRGQPVKLTNKMGNTGPPGQRGRDSRRYINLAVLDLHGYTTHDGWKKFGEFIHDCEHSQFKFARVITGQGIMKNEFSHWVDNNPYLRNHKLENTNGSYIVKFKKRFGMRK